MEQYKSEKVARAILNTIDELDGIIEHLETEREWLELLNELDRIHFAFYEWAEKSIKKIRGKGDETLKLLYED